MGIYRLLGLVLLLISLSLVISINFSQKIVVNVIEVLNFSITNYTFLSKKNFFEGNVFLYNIGSKSFKSKLILESECCKVFSEEIQFNPSEENYISIYYFAFRNESINISISIDDFIFSIKNYEIVYTENINKTEKNIFYLFENNKLKIIGDLEGYYFLILNSTTKQRRLKSYYNEIEINNENENSIKIVFFNENSHFIKEFKLKKPNIFSKILFEIRKILVLTFLA